MTSQGSSRRASGPRVLLAAKTYTVAYSRQVAPLDSSGEVVGPVRNHVTMKQWGDMSQVFIANGRARLPESLDDSGNLERVPGVDTVAKRLAWRAGICLGLVLIGFLAGTLELRKENEHLSSVIRSLPYSMQAPALLQSH